MKIKSIDVEMEHEGRTYALTVECPAIVVQRFVRVADHEAEMIPQADLQASPLWPHVRNVLSAMRRAFPGGDV